MKTIVIYLSVFLLFNSPARAGDHVVVVDSSYAMRVFIPVKVPLKNSRNRTVTKQKRKLSFVQQQLEQYFEQIPNDGSRVYVVYYNNGIAKLKGKPLATEFVFGENGEGKRAALAQAGKYSQIVPTFNLSFAELLLNKKRNNHLWSSFHKALKHAEDNKYYQPAKGKQPEVFPHVLLITDEPGDQKGEEAWDFRRVNPGDDDEDHIITLKHLWLLRHAHAVWYQIGYEDSVSEHWKGKVVKIRANEKLASLPPVNPPVIELSGKNQPFKINEPVQMKAHGDERVVQYQWTWKVADGKFSKPLSGRSQAPKFDRSGFYTIRLEAISNTGRPPLATETVIQIGGAEPSPPPPDKPLDIAAAFSLQIEGKDKQPRPIKNAEVIWTFNPEGIPASFLNETAAKVEGKEVNAEFIYDWSLGGDKPGKENLKQPARRNFKPGQYTIGLAVTQKDKIKNTDKAEALSFEIRLVQVKHGIKIFNGKIFKTKPGQPVEFELTETSAPKGTTYEWDFGDGSPSLKEKNPRHAYQKSSQPNKPFQPKVTLTLPDGQKDVQFIASTIEVTKDFIVAKVVPDLAWPGQPVKLQLPPEINLKEIEKVIWTVDGENIEANLADQFALSVPFPKPGPHTVPFTVKKTNVTELISGEAKLNIRAVNPKVTTKVQEVFIGQPLEVDVTNAAAQNGSPPFPKNHQVKLSGTDLKTLGTKQVFFTAAGEKEIQANVLLPGAAGQSFPSTTAVKIRVKAIIPKIGIKLGK